MSRADDLRAKYEAELAVVELEEELLALKDADADPATLRETKLRLREARQAHRLQREGDANATPATIDAVAAVHNPEG